MARISQKHKLIKLLPEKLQSKIGQEKEGPNCWNATINFHKPKTPSRFTSGKYMDKWLKKNTKPIKSKEAKTGDILVFRAPNYKNDPNFTATGSSLVHTVVLLKNKKIFHKVGWGGAYEITTIKRAKRIYNYTSHFQWRRIK